MHRLVFSKEPKLCTYTHTVYKLLLTTGMFSKELKLCTCIYKLVFSANPAQGMTSVLSSIVYLAVFPYLAFYSTMCSYTVLNKLYYMYMYIYITCIHVYTCMLYNEFVIGSLLFVFT